jgi:hypothetical protein
LRIKTSVREEFAHNKFDTIVDNLYRRIRGGGAGGTGCQMATGFSVLIFAISLIVTSRLSEHKAKLNIIFTINILY